jgi:hypothetical protein
MLIPHYRRDDVDPARRAFVIAALRNGFVGGWLGTLPLTAWGQALGQVPRKLPPGQSIYSLKGDVTVNDQIANQQTAIAAGDVIATGSGAEIIFAVEYSAYILRSDSRLELPKSTVAASPLRLLTGALLSVFGRREQRIETVVATIGIRGTGIYIESEPDRSYVCTCYGTADLRAADTEDVLETVVSEHHDAPRYILGPAETGARIRTAPFKNHSDMELALIEELVGRAPPFSFTFERYDSPTDVY